MAPKIELIIDGFTLCEAPHWDVDTQSLYFVDKHQDHQSINRYFPETKIFNRATLVGSAQVNGAAFLAPVSGTSKQFVVAMGNQLNLLEWDGESERIDEDTIQPLKTVTYQFNDGKVDPVGRLWGGTQNVNMDDIEKTPPDGCLYCLDSQQLLKKLEDIRIANGLTWNLEQNKFYYIDSLTYGVDCFDYNNETGAISNRRQLFSLKDYNIPGMPDGMTIDADGNLWVAVYQGHQVLKIDGQDGQLLDTIPEIRYVTSLCFGGKNLDELYVTCGSVEEPLKGGVYRITELGVKGLPMHNYVL